VGQPALAKRAPIHPILDVAAAQPSFLPHRHSYLDFACGSGRLLELLAPEFQIKVGLDISAQMIDRAAQNVPHAQLYRRNVTEDPTPLIDSFDLITVFRFVLNSDHDDRFAALSWLSAQLRDSESLMIINNHGNLWSHKLFSHLARRLFSTSTTVTGNVMSGRAFERIVEAAGLRVVSRRGFGFLGGTLAGVVGMTRMKSIQASLNRLPFIDRFAEDQIYVVARA